jgi:hypothetical protein
VFGAAAAAAGSATGCRAHITHAAAHGSAGMASNYRNPMAPLKRAYAVRPDGDGALIEGMRATGAHTDPPVSIEEYDDETGQLVGLAGVTLDDACTSPGGAFYDKEKATFSVTLGEGMEPIVFQNVEFDCASRDMVVRWLGVGLTKDDFLVDVHCSLEQATGRLVTSVRDMFYTYGHNDHAATVGDAITRATTGVPPTFKAGDVGMVFVYAVHCFVHLVAGKSVTPRSWWFGAARRAAQPSVIVLEDVWYNVENRRTKTTTLQDTGLYRWQHGFYGQYGFTKSEGECTDASFGNERCVELHQNFCVDDILPWFAAHARSARFSQRHHTLEPAPLRHKRARVSGAGERRMD